MDTSSLPPVPNVLYKQAAVAYLIYGVVYLVGAIYLAEAGLTERGAGNGWVWFLVGIVFLIVFPWIISRGVRWFTLAVAAFMVLRIAGLTRIMMTDWSAAIPVPWGGVMAKGVGAAVFSLVTLGAMLMLVRAAWKRQDPMPVSPETS